MASIGPSDLLLLCWILSGIPLELEFYFWERVLNPLLVTVQNLLSFSWKKQNWLTPLPTPLLSMEWILYFLMNIFGLLTSVRRAKMKNQFCDVAKIGDFCNFLAFPQIMDWFLHWIFKIEFVFSLKHHHSISNKGNTIQKFAYILSKINENFLSSFLYR